MDFSVGFLFQLKLNLFAVRRTANTFRGQNINIVLIDIIFFFGGTDKIFNMPDNICFRNIIIDLRYAFVAQNMIFSVGKNFNFDSIGADINNAKVFYFCSLILGQNNI